MELFVGAAAVESVGAMLADSSCGWWAAHRCNRTETRRRFGSQYNQSVSSCRPVDFAILASRSKLALTEPFSYKQSGAIVTRGEETKKKTYISVYLRKASVGFSKSEVNLLKANSMK